MIRMESLNGLLHRCVYFNYSIYTIWVLCNGLFLFFKLDYLKIPKLLVVAAYLIITITFTIKLFLVHNRNFTSDISKLTRFFLLTILIQMPLVSFFLFSFPLLLYTPVEVCLHVLLLFMTITESTLSFLAVWKAVKYASIKYPPHSRYYPPIELQTSTQVLHEVEEGRPPRIFRPRHNP